MKSFILNKYPHRFWRVAELNIYNKDKLVETVDINKFYEITKDKFYIYDTTGGTGIGWKKGDINRIIDISDSEFKTVSVIDEQR